MRHGEIMLSRSESLVRSAAKPAHRLNKVARYTTHGPVHHGEIELRVRVSALCRSTDLTQFDVRLLHANHSR